MSKPTLEQVLDLMEERAYPVFGPAPYDLTLVGLRAVPGTADAWDDWICVLYHDDDGTLQMEAFQGTTDPGRKWLQEPCRPEGCAILLPGRYPGMWTIGLHQGRYEALKQVGPADFARDPDGDMVIETEGPGVTIQRGQYIGCNCHRASTKGLAKTVGAYSAACQVIRAIEDFEQLMWLCKEQRRRGRGSSYTYCLIPWRG